MVCLITVLEINSEQEAQEKKNNENTIIEEEPPLKSPYDLLLESLQINVSSHSRKVCVFCFLNQAQSRVQIQTPSPIEMKTKVVRRY
jgi:hypothetical protein